ncbi:aberrant root formation protein 4 [Canna indica]|uniref:Aberrant root formation protein 4 n=1 Tax=Canna indica TaxID=4628 RepID=A0AAQ3JZJ7_9LILI|nr:aberrant root formation protein 4 [Canna indica]
MATESSSSELILPEVHCNGYASLPPCLRLHRTLDVCTESFESGDLARSERAVAALVEILNSIVDPPQSDSGDVVTDDSVAENVLEEIYEFLSSPSSNQTMIEALSLELPKVVVKFVTLSDRCREMVQSIIESLLVSCSPRDMLSILCEALACQIGVSKSPTYFIPLLDGISKILPCIQRRHLEQVKVALPIILNILHASSSESDEEDKDNLRSLFGAAVNIGISIQGVCGEMVGRIKDELRGILGLYALQNIALISRIKHADIISNYCSLVVQLSQFLSFCGFSCFGLITGSEVTSVIDEISKDDVDDGDFLTFFPFAANGAALAVIWGHVSNEVREAAMKQLTTVLSKIQSNQSERWLAIGMLQPILSSIYYSWEIKSYCIDMLVILMDGSNSGEQNDNDTNFSAFMPNLFAALQAIQRIIIAASDVSLRKKAFSTLRKLISDLPLSHRFDMLKALVIDCNSPSMIAILIDLVREEIVAERNQNTSLENIRDIHLERRLNPFWSSCALDLVELVLKPPKGGPPSFPEDSDPVLSALNLFRFILIMESTGKTNHSGVLSESTLRKAYSEWLLPLRTLVTGIQAENEKDESELADDILCALNPVQLVLYRCIELVEGNLKHS